MRLSIPLTILLIVQLTFASPTWHENPFIYHNLCNNRDDTALVPPPVIDISETEAPYIQERVYEFRQIADALIYGDDDVTALTEMSDTFSLWLTVFTEKLAFFMYFTRPIHTLTINIAVTFTELIVKLKFMVDTALSAAETLTGTSFELTDKVLSIPWDYLSAFQEAVWQVTGCPEIVANVDSLFINYLNLVVYLMYESYSLAYAAIKPTLYCSLVDSLSDALYEGPYLIAYEPDYLITLEQFKALANYELAAIETSIEQQFSMLPRYFSSAIYDILEALSAISVQTNVIFDMIIAAFEYETLEETEVVVAVEITAARIDVAVLNFLSAILHLIYEAEEQLTTGIVYVLAYIEYNVWLTVELAYDVIKIASLTLDHYHHKTLATLFDYMVPLKAIYVEVTRFFLAFEDSDSTDTDELYDEMKSLLQSSIAVLVDQVQEFIKYIKLEII